MSFPLFNLARWCFRHRRIVLSLWLLIAISAITLATVSGGKTNDNFTIPGTESQNMSDLLAQKLPQLSGGQTQVVFAAKGGAKVTDATDKQAIEQTIAALAKVDGVASAADPFQLKTVSPDQTVAIGQVQYTKGASDVTDATFTGVEDAVKTAQSAGLDVEYSGSAFPGWRTAISEVPELVGLIIAFLILIVTFGALIAAGMPILNAIIGVVTTIMGVTAVASVVTIASASTTVATMLGLSCGIDYGLFILSRHRNNLLAGMEPEESMGRAAGTAGSSVVFAALTVIIALCGLVVVGIPFLSVMGLAAAAAVFIALMISMTLLPALLGFAGVRVTRFIRWPWRPDHTAEVARIAVHDPQRAFGARWARFVVHNRVAVLVGGVLLLAVLALPITGMRLGLPSGGSQPTDTTQRKAYDLITHSFGEGFNAQLTVVADGATTPAATKQISAALSTLPDVVSVVPAVQTQDLSLITVTPKDGPNDQSTADLVNYIRGHRAEVEGTSGAHILVGGTTASNIDVSKKLGSALPIFLIVVIGLAFVLLTFAFRTILVPIKSIIGFLLSVGAAFGAEVAVFQFGWGASLLGVTPTETISFLPIIMLAIIFGLSSDYEVFVVSRIKEEFTKHGDARGAVERGTGFSARVVTAAALIMFSIFVAFMINKDPTIRAIGFAFAVGVFLDAFVVRLTLVPAVMAIVRSKLWYHPQWFAKYVPDPDIEGEKLERRLAARAVTADD